jgi:predicted enzyme related to lactoylglutathione lyase
VHDDGGEKEDRMGNPFVHIELATNDLDKAKSFYGALFDWEMKDEAMGGGMSYTIIRVGQGTGGGMMKQMMPGAPSAWMPYVDVADIRAATDKAKTLGAKIMRDVMPVMEEGFIAIITDPTGAHLGLWQARKK